MFGRGVKSSRQVDFSESAAAASDLKVDPGFELMEYFLGLPEEEAGSPVVKTVKRRRKGAKGAPPAEEGKNKA
jgi:hypothetical protein